MKYINEKNGGILIGLLAIGTMLALLNSEPIAQDILYHQFSDTHSFFSIPNSLNVISNLPFLFVGALGLLQLLKTNTLQIVSSNKPAYIAIFLGTALVAFGSGYYHLSPNNETLVWDRIPMTIAFMGLFSVIITEFISEKIGKIALFPLLILGLSSVIYWHFTELNGAGDLRFYVLIQFFPLLSIPIILLFFNPKYDNTPSYWWLLFTYILAKIFELLDSQTHEIIHIISGHSIKHICAAVGLYILLKSYKSRKYTSS